MSGRKRASSKHNRGKSGQRASSRPNDPSIEAREQLLLQAVLAYQADRLAEAEELCRDLSAQSPRFVPAKLLFGMIAGKTGRPQLGIDTLREAVAADPDYLEPHIELASLLNAEGQVAAAISICEEALAHWPESAGLYNMLGLALMSDGRASEAVGTFQRAIAIDPTIAMVYHNLGMSMQAAGRDQGAIEAYRQAIARAPSFADTYAQLAHLLFAHGRRDEARESLRRGGEEQPSSAIGRLMKAELALGEGRPDEAESLVRKVIAEDPASAAAHHLLAIVQQQAGRFADARASYEKTAELSPNRTTAFLGLVMSGKLDAADRPLLDRLLTLLRSSNVPDASRADIHYALGKGFDDLMEWEQAMWHFDAANVIVADRVNQTGMGFDSWRHHADIERMIEAFSADFFKDRAAFGRPSDLPVLIVGMPRSGTTLVEQIISSHPAIGAGGEQHFWPNRSSMVGPAMTDAIPPRDLQRVAEEYYTTLHTLAPEARRVTDKMPANFLLLGLIHLALPNARIIHCRRHAIDTCLSIYSTPFSNLVNFAHNRDDIVAYYRDYAKLMAHWRQVLPRDRLIEIDYEQLVADHEDVARRLIGFCGLEWDEACLRHEQNPHAIHTPSWWQARQPVYRTSVGRWRRYGPWLGAFSLLFDDGTTMSDRD